MPPRTHCSAATSCGGVRSNWPSGRGESARGESGRDESDRGASRRCSTGRAGSGGRTGSAGRLGSGGTVCSASRTPSVIDIAPPPHAPHRSIAAVRQFHERRACAAYERGTGRPNRPVDEPRDNLWIPGHSLCAACAQLVDISWGRRVYNPLTCSFATHRVWGKETLRRHAGCDRVATDRRQIVKCESRLNSRWRLAYKPTNIRIRGLPRVGTSFRRATKGPSRRTARCAVGATAGARTPRESRLCRPRILGRPVFGPVTH
jgi:hypothetical protein